MPEIEQHPLSPFLPPNAKLLMLGSFPPPKSRWKMNFYYPNLQNDMWRIFGLAFFQNKDYFLNESKNGFNQLLIQQFLCWKGIALSDTAFRVVRLKENASDKFLDIVEKIDLERILELISGCDAIAATGEKAAETLLSIVSPGLEVPSPGNFVNVDYQNRSLAVWRMPSSSRAYPKPLEEKAEAYKRMFLSVGLL
ncbi:MAG: DNA glycosylase [Bacteroidales bacterium 45-6]|nr:MAG: DNA glycosylase [Bacteroidales bacterium 45-6]